LQDLLVDVHQAIHLGDGKDIEMLMNVEQFQFMELGCISQAEDNNIHDLVADIEGSQISQVDLHSHFKGIIG